MVSLQVLRSKRSVEEIWEQGKTGKTTRQTHKPVGFNLPQITVTSDDEISRLTSTYPSRRLKKPTLPPDHVFGIVLPPDLYGRNAFPCLKNEIRNVQRVKVHVKVRHV